MATAIKNQSQSIISVIAANLFMLGWAACSAQARAADETVVGVEKVSYGDLNLATEAGAEVLYRRLRRAAAEVCNPLGSLHAVVQAGWRACYDKAMNSAVASVNKPMVTALHNRLSGISTASTSKDHTVTVALHVSAQGLDLSHPADAEKFYARLKNAAWVVCTRGNRVNLKPEDNPMSCAEHSLGAAIRSANAPALTQIYLATHTLQQAAAYGIKIPLQAAAQ